MQSQKLNVVCGKMIKRLEVGPQHFVIHIEGIPEPLILQISSLNRMPVIQPMFAIPPVELSQKLITVEPEESETKYYDFKIGHASVRARTGDYILARNGNIFSFHTGDSRPAIPPSGYPAKVMKQSDWESLSVKYFSSLRQEPCRVGERFYFK